METVFLLTLVAGRYYSSGDEPIAVFTHHLPQEYRLQRVCFILQVRPERLDEYRQRHREVWPEMCAALTASGWRDYSLFLRPDGLLVGYLQCENFEAALAAMEVREVNDRWQREMAPFFVQEGHADDAMVPLQEVFHLE